MYTAFFAPEYSGAAIQALTLAGELRRRGHHVEFVTNRWPGLADSAVVDGFAVRRLGPALIGLLVVALYGGMVFGVLPFQPGVSWQGHLFGAIAGVLLGLRLGRADRVVRRPVI